MITTEQYKKAIICKMQIVEIAKMRSLNQSEKNEYIANKKIIDEFLAEPFSQLWIDFHNPLCLKCLEYLKGYCEGTKKRTTISM